MLEISLMPVWKGETIPHQLDQIKQLSQYEIFTKYRRVRSSLINIPIYTDKKAGYPYSQFESTSDIPFNPYIFEDGADLIIKGNLKTFAEADMILGEAVGEVAH